MDCEVPSRKYPSGTTLDRDIKQESVDDEEHTCQLGVIVKTENIGVEEDPDESESFRQRNSTNKT